MFENLAFGNLGDLGSVQAAVDWLNGYKGIGVPPEVSDFLARTGYPDPPYPPTGVRNPRIVALEKLDSVRAFEARLEEVLRNINIVYSGGETAMYSLKSPSLLRDAFDLAYLYFTDKEAYANSWTGTGTGAWYANKYFGGWDRYYALTQLFPKLEEREGLDQTIEGKLKTSEIEFSMLSMPRLDFFNKRIVPIAGKFSESDQRFLRDAFVMKQEGGLSCDEVYRVGRLLAPHFTKQELAPLVPVFTAMVLGKLEDWSFWSVERSLSGSDAASLLASRYSLIKSHLGKWLDLGSGVDQKFASVLDLTRQYFASNPAELISRTSQLQYQINQAIFYAPVQAFWAGVTSLDGGAAKTENTANAQDAAMQAAVKAMESGATPEEAAKAAAAAAAKQANQVSDINQKGGKGLLIGGLLLVGYLLTRGDE